MTDETPGSDDDRPLTDEERDARAERQFEGYYQPKTGDIADDD